MLTEYSDEELENGTEDGSDVAYTLTKNDSDITPDFNLKGTDEIAEHTYTLTVNYDEKKGTVYGGGDMVTCWKYIGGSWYYFNSSGSMRTANLRQGGKTYRFYSSGACINP